MVYSGIIFERYVSYISNDFVWYWEGISEGGSVLFCFGDVVWCEE